MVTLTSWENTVQDQLTPKFPIKHKSKKNNKKRCAHIRVYVEIHPAFSLLSLQGVWEDGSPIHRDRGLEMKYVQGGCDCSTRANLICTSPLLPGYATMKSISSIPGHQSRKLPLGWHACFRKEKRGISEKGIELGLFQSFSNIHPSTYYLVITA